VRHCSCLNHNNVALWCDFLPVCGYLQFVVIFVARTRPWIQAVVNAITCALFASSVKVIGDPLIFDCILFNVAPFLAAEERSHVGSFIITVVLPEKIRNDCWVLWLRASIHLLWVETEERIHGVASKTLLNFLTLF
jgi:hypothetical protein